MVTEVIASIMCSQVSCHLQHGRDIFLLQLHPYKFLQNWAREMSLLCRTFLSLLDLIKAIDNIFWPLSSNLPLSFPIMPWMRVKGKLLELSWLEAIFFPKVPYKDGIKNRLKWWNQGKVCFDCFAVRVRVKCEVIKIFFKIQTVPKEDNFWNQ